jgi:hypothetical protein
MIHKTTSSLFLSILFFSACPKTNIDVGSVAIDGGTNKASQTGGAITAPGGSGGDQTALGGASGRGIIFDGDAGREGDLVYQWRVGASCDIEVDASPSMGVFNTAAPECSGLCIKPVVSPDVPEPDTSAFCTTSCSTDDDCVGLLRNPNDPNDRRCVSGYTCGIIFVKGPLCCKKMCVCEDFTGGPIPQPNGCSNGADLTCNISEP